MTFEDWFMNGEEPLHDVVWEDGPHKGRDVAGWLREAFEAGYDACYKDWGGLPYDDPYNRKTKERK